MLDWRYVNACVNGNPCLHTHVQKKATPNEDGAAPAMIQQVCAKLSQHDPNDYVMDEMGTRGACLHVWNECMLAGVFSYVSINSANPRH